MSYTILRGQEPGSSGFITDAQAMENDGVVPSDPKNAVEATKLVLSAAETAGTGTLSTTGTAVVGVGTAFTTELSENGYFKATDKAYKIATITDNTNLVLEAAPAVDLSGEAFTVLPSAQEVTTKSVEPFNVTTYVEESIDRAQVYGDIVTVVAAQA